LPLAAGHSHRLRCAHVDGWQLLLREGQWGNENESERAGGNAAQQSWTKHVGFSRRGDMRPRKSRRKDATEGRDPSVAFSLSGENRGSAGLPGTDVIAITDESIVQIDPDRLGSVSRQAQQRRRDYRHNAINPRSMVAGRAKQTIRRAMFVFSRRFFPDPRGETVRLDHLGNIGCMRQRVDRAMRAESK